MSIGQCLTFLPLNGFPLNLIACNIIVTGKGGKGRVGAGGDGGSVASGNESIDVFVNTTGQIKTGDGGLGGTKGGNGGSILSANCKGANKDPSITFGAIGEYHWLILWMLVF